MTTKTLVKQLNDLSKEVVILRSIVIGAIAEKDPEGEYRPEFVKKIFGLVQKNQSAMKFTTSTDLLKKIS